MISAIAYSCTTQSSEKSQIDVQSEQYQQTVGDFYTSLAAIQSDQALFAVEKMQDVSEMYPEEPAVWANLGVFAMRQGNFELATERITKAINGAPDNAEIQFLAGILESRKGNIPEAREYLEKAAAIDPSNLQIQFSLINELERQDPEGNSGEIKERLEHILEEDPGNLAVLLEVVRTSAKLNEQSAVNETLQKIEEQSGEWPEQIQEQFQEQKTAILDKEGENITFELAFLRNNLNQLPRFQYDLSRIQMPASQVAFLIDRFLLLPNPEHLAASIDAELSFDKSDNSQRKVANLFMPIGFASEESASTIAVNPGEAVVNDTLRLIFPGRQASEPFSPHAVAAIDYNYDFLNDLALVGTAGLRFYRLNQDSTFTDITGALGLSSDILNESYYGAWASDIDLDGDLDLLLAPHEGPMRVLRNNGDGSFEVRYYFEEAENVRDFLWADFDQDGDPDAVLRTEEGEVYYYRNERSGEFQRDTAFPIEQPVYALDFGDINSDGFFEIISWQEEQITNTAYADSTGQWQHDQLLAVTDTTASINSGARLFIADLDNNGALDVLISNKGNTTYWLSDEDISLSPDGYRPGIDIQVAGVADMDGDARLDLVGLSNKGLPLILNNSGSVDYHGRVLRPRASGPQGDQRINSFGIGGEIESRSGLQYTKRAIRQPWVHIGLGTYEEAAMVRITWPNGSTQAEFAELGYESQIMNEQILKGSCPWIFAYNGQEIEFVTDFLWRTALGLRINAQGKANVIHSIDWVKLDGDQLKPRNGYYDVRITADLWETHFFDHVSLMAIDHPKESEVFVDERFVLPAPEQELYVMKEVQPVGSAADFRGRDVTEAVKKRDGRYVDSLPLTAYQGLAEEHYIEISLGNRSSDQGKEWLIASGWIYPTDTSINIAISQGDHPSPRGIRVEVPDGKGGWQVVRENIGFPAGKNKTIMVGLDGIFNPGTERRVRLYTTMEIYWDQFRVGVRAPDTDIQTVDIAAETSELRYRGFSKLENKKRFKPTTADYRQVAGTTPKWRDLIGYYTRFGDVGALTKEIDDRYVIMNAGDELLLRFPALDPPPEGWERDFVLVGDGWVKDGDYNTGHSKTILPLPYHGMDDYSESPRFLWDDPVYQKHKQDWVQYHTRYVTPRDFNTALRFKKR